MKIQTAAAVVVAFLLAMSAGFVLGNRQNTSVVADPGTLATTTTASEPVAVFVAPGETVVGPVVIVADEPHLDGEQLVFDFEITGLAPIGDAATVLQYAGFGSTRELLPQDLDTVFPDSWTLTTPEGPISGSVANPAARAARFEVGPDFDLETITSVSISSYALLAPIDAAISLGSGMESAPVAPGITARLLAITEQDNTIIQVELTSQREFNLNAITIAGDGPGWVAAVREAEGRPRWNLTYNAPQVPSPIDLTVSGSIWIPVDKAVPVVFGDGS